MDQCEENTSSILYCTAVIKAIYTAVRAAIVFELTVVLCVCVCVCACV